MSHAHPTIKPVELTLGGVNYHLLFTFAALSIAQTRLPKIGVQANLLHALDIANLTPDMVAPLLFAAMITCHPHVDYAHIEALVTFKTLGEVMSKITDAYIASLADPAPQEEAVAPLAEAAQS